MLDNACEIQKYTHAITPVNNAHLHIHSCISLHTTRESNCATVIAIFLAM